MLKLIVNKLQIVNNEHLYGPGKRLLIVFQGCNLHCKGCINKHLWSFSNGTLISEQTIFKYLSDVDGVTLFGGEPLDQSANLKPLIQIIKKLNKTIILFTGYKKNELNNEQKFIWNNSDIVKSGRFEISKINTNLQFRGSTNQRVYFHKGKYKNYKLDDSFSTSILTINNFGEIEINGFYTKDIDCLVHEFKNP